MEAQIHAAGFVLYRREGREIRYLTLRSARHGDIGTPKGHREPGESDLATALRETGEETGLKAAQLAPNEWFRRTTRYPVNDRLKEVVYLLARTEVEEMRISGEHDAYAWRGLGDALAELRHDNLRELFSAAAAFLKDPALRGGLTPEAARALLERKVGADAPVVGHTAQVAGMARTMAEAWGEVEADYVEAAGWLHDIGRAKTHGRRHPVEGFHLVVEAGFPGYAAPCLSHYTKGRPHDEFGDLADEMWRACDLDTFDVEERLIALADFMAAGDRRATPVERHADLVRRYGRSEFFDRSLDVARALESDFEKRTGQALYPLLGIE